ncbi:baseplate J/gp47 family protein [bacterium]|nr:baseplate J/gp47 family protein [bacterium]
MAINIKNYIRESIKSSAVGVDSRSGSVWSDLVGNPLTHILEKYEVDQAVTLNDLSLKDETIMSEEALDKVAENFLLTRNSGSYSYGSVKLYFNSPTEVTIPRNTRFSNEDGTKVFETTSNYTITSSSMSLNQQDYFPLYSTGSVTVRSVSKGEEVNVGPYEIVKSVTFAGSPVKIENSAPTVGGVHQETNTEFKSRIISSMLGPNISSVAGIQNAIKQEFPSIVDVKVIGSGDSRMTRDFSMLVESAQNFKEEDFYLVYPDQQTNFLSKGHEAFYGEFIDLDETANIKLPSPDGFSDEREFDDVMYEGLMLSDDLRGAEFTVSSIATELFTDDITISGSVSNTTLTTSGL